MDKLKKRLEQLCEAKGIDRFEPDEIVELLEDGESVDWIVSQLAPDAEAGDTQELAGLLREIGAAAGPKPSPEAESPETPEELADQQATESAPTSDLSGMLQSADLQLPPGVDPGQVQQLLASPQGEMLADFGAFCQEKGVDTESGQEGMEDLLRELHEEWLHTPREALEGKKPTEVMEGGRLLPHKVETYRREEPKVGRNDPCPCGSGKKYKRCCGKGG